LGEAGLAFACVLFCFAFFGGFDFLIFWGFWSFVLGIVFGFLVFFWSFRSFVGFLIFLALDLECTGVAFNILFTHAQ
jgi:hypothetical protein